jgi:hypothetical protein
MSLVVAASVFAFAMLQLVPPSIEVRPARNEVEMPADVETVLRTSCFDCHSNETHLAWFDHIAPASWLVARDVRHARAVLNFSELGARPLGEQRAKLFEGIEMMSAHVMPLVQYRALHRGAIVTASGLQRLRAFATTLAAPSSEGKVLQISLDALPKQPTPAPNEMRVPPDLASWTPVEMSERWDNGTVRIILANAIALDAVKTDHRSPWPEGASLAKAAWKPGDGANPSAFVQVELMAKRGDAWEWARWVGGDLTPYGRDSSFDEECRRCHEPMRARDFVYTLPEGSFDPAWGVVTSMVVERGRFRVVVRSTDEETRTVVWAQRDDPNWFGAKISTGAPSKEVDR